MAGLLGGLAAANHDRAYLTGVDLPELVWPLVRALLKRLIDLRARWLSLREGSTRVERSTEDSLIVSRSVPAEQAWIAVNRSDEPMPFEIVDAVEGWVIDGLEVLPYERVVPPGASAWVRTTVSPWCRSSSSSPARRVRVSVRRPCAPCWPDWPRPRS